MDPLPARRPAGRAWLRGRGWVWPAIIVAVLALAWFDGGEEPIHPIAQDIPVPEAR